MKNYYDILGLNKNATQDDIKKAYREMCKKYHPDRTGGDDTKIKEINEAYATLGDENKKRVDSLDLATGSGEVIHSGWRQI